MKININICNYKQIKMFEYIDFELVKLVSNLFLILM